MVFWGEFADIYVTHRLESEEYRTMTVQGFLSEPNRVDEPGEAHEYSDVLSQVASDGRPVIVRRNGEDLAAIVPLEHLELVREILGRKEVQELAAEIDWDRAVQTLRPPQTWFDGDEPKPF
jgi:prevent-host-death family protein